MDCVLANALSLKVTRISPGTYGVAAFFELELGAAVADEAKTPAVTPSNNPAKSLLCVIKV
jgi:hypothetical protein